MSRKRGEGVGYVVPSFAGSQAAAIAYAEFRNEARGAPARSNRAGELILVDEAVIGEADGLVVTGGDDRLGHYAHSVSQWVTRRRSTAAALIAFCSFSNARTSI